MTQDSNKMNQNKLKTYAPKARRDFITAVTDRAAIYGLTKDKIESVTIQGDVAIIEGKPFPKDVAEKRKRLAERIRREGFEYVMEAMAYTWFNRFVAIRFMELHGYLGHGYRVLSHPEGNTVPEISEHGEHVDFPGLDKEKVIELKLDGTKEAELYRILLIAECNALHKAMPFLFEEIGGYTELLLPDNLLHSNSPIRNLVSEIPEEDWQDIEIIGWLYQFYISEKKDQVIGKVVKAEDIPAATQLFTPNWIVKYMVQNSLGAQWLATYPQSPLKGQMEYYIEPAEQTDEVNAQLAAITPDSLNPEKLTLIDPACGSGHILVEAYELFKAIYLERGYRQRDVPQLILTQNLFGLDIDERAAQLTGFALMMKGRADDRRLFERGVKLNVMALGDSAGFDADRLAKGVDLANYGLESRDLTELKRLFEHATTFGSLIQVPERLTGKLPALKQLSEATSQDLFVSGALNRLRPLVRQAELLAAQYDAVVMNPPYMSSSSMNAAVKMFAKDNFPDAKSDLFACFIQRGCMLARDAGYNAMITMQSWMFISSFQKMREWILKEKTIRTMAHLGSRAFGSISGEVVQSTAFVLKNLSIQKYKPAFFRLLNGGEEEKQTALANGTLRFDATTQDEFTTIPGSPVVYWIYFLRLFESEKVGRKWFSGGRIKTHDGPKYLRYCWETSRPTSRWRQIIKGGEYRKHAGNEEFLVDWSPSAIAFYESNGGMYPTKMVEKEGICWTKITSGPPSFRIKRDCTEYDSASPTIFNDEFNCDYVLLAQLNSPIAQMLVRAMNPTLNTQVADVLSLPHLKLSSDQSSSVDDNERSLVRISVSDWNAYERSWDFQSVPILTASSDPTPTLESSYTAWITQNRETIAEMKRLEEKNNRLFIDAYGLQDELTPDVPLSQITLTVNPAYRYGGKLTIDAQWTRFRQDTMQELVSYAIGCMMGRYSLDAPGLIYAHSGNDGFDPRRYPTFPADADGIVPLTDTEWFDDDACHRLIKFISVAWDASHLEANLTFLADNLSPKKGEGSRETIRRYLCDSFFKDHLKTYKKRPIYWLFSSGKLRAFQCLVYLHRYNEGTLARMRTEYAIPLQGKIAARIEQLSGDITAATSTAHSKKLERERDKLVKQQVELHAFDEKLRHYADQRISLDLDDGVKVNYGRFGDLLAEVKAITGKAKE